MKRVKPMEVHFTPELHRKLNRIAAEQERDSESVVQEAVERLVEYHDWFLSEVEKGLESAERGEFREHEEVGKLIENRYPG
jgi:predicted transcriptional regulator